MEAAQDPSGHEVATIELVKRVRRGDALAREALFARYQGRVLAIVRVRLSARMRTRLESQDVLQDVLLEALRDLERFEMRDESSLIRWLAVLVEHRIGAHARAQLAVRRDGNVRALDSGDAERLGADAPAPSQVLSAEESRQRVQEALAHLPEPQRELVLLRDYAGVAWQEIADELGLDSADAARMLHARALVRLASVLRALPPSS